MFGLAALVSADDTLLAGRFPRAREDSGASRFRCDPVETSDGRIIGTSYRAVHGNADEVAGVIRFYSWLHWCL